MRTALALGLLIGACSRAAAPAPAPVIDNAVAPPLVTGPWLLDGEIIGAAAGRVYVWDRAWLVSSGGLSEYVIATGELADTRSIAGLPSNGGLALWEPVPGGFLAHWDAPTLVRETAGALAVAWTAAGDDWFGTQVVVGDSVIASRGRETAGVARLALADGHPRWQAPLVPWSQDVTVATDGDAVYTTWQEYDPRAPTPTVVKERRVRALDLATGAVRWTYDFAEAPGALVVSRGTIVAAIGGDLVFLDGARGRARKTVALGPPTVYPTLVLDGDRVICAYDRKLRAFTLDGAVVWEADVTLDGGPRLALAGADVVVTTAADTALAFDRATGERRWEVGLGLDADRLIGAPGWLVAIAGSQAAGFALPPAMPVESARVHGRVLEVGCGDLAGLQVMVSDVVVPVDAGGRYDATVVGRGVLTVAVIGAGRMARDGAVGRTTVRLDGRRDYLVPDLSPSFCSGE